jgi:hypothetical protein
VILRSNGSLGRGKPPNALRAKGVEKEEEEALSLYAAVEAAGSSEKLVTIFNTARHQNPGKGKIGPVL